MNRLVPYRRNNVVRRDPFFSSVFDDDFFNSFFGSVPATYQMRTDVKDNGDSYTIIAELPGLEKENIELKAEDNKLLIKAEYEQQNDDENNGYIRKERRYGSYTRQFDLTGVDQDKIKAEYKNGLLNIELPKAAPPEDTSKFIDIG